MRFQSNACPLCGKSLRLRMVAGVMVYECPTVLDNLPKNSHNSHYMVEKDASLEIQHMIVLPYCVDTYAGSSKSRVYQLADNKWKLIKEVPTLIPERAETLKVSIQKLL